VSSTPSHRKCKYPYCYKMESKWPINLKNYLELWIVI